MLYMYKPLTVTAIYPFDKNPTREEWEDYDYMMRRAGSSNKYALPLKNPDHLEHSGISRNIQEHPDQAHAAEKAQTITCASSVLSAVSRAPPINLLLSPASLLA